MDLLTVLVLANFGFTCGAYAYTWVVERRYSNHYNERMRALEQRVRELENRAA